MQRTLVCFGLLFVLALAPVFEAFCQDASKDRSGRAPVASKDRQATGRKGGFWANTSKWRERLLPFTAEKEAAEKETAEKEAEQTNRRTSRQRRTTSADSLSQTGRPGAPVTRPTSTQTAPKGLVTMPAISGPPASQRPSVSVPRRETFNATNPQAAASRAASRAAPARTPSQTVTPVVRRTRPVGPVATAELREGKSSRRTNRAQSTAPRAVSSASAAKRQPLRENREEVKVASPVVSGKSPGNAGSGKESAEVRVSDRPLGKSAPLTAGKSRSVASPKTAVPPGRRNTGPRYTRPREPGPRDTANRSAAAAGKNESVAGRPRSSTVTVPGKTEQSVGKSSTDRKPVAVARGRESQIRGASTKATTVSRVNPAQGKSHLRQGPAEKKKVKSAEVVRPTRVSTRLASRTVGAELGGSLLFSKGPQLSVETLGPREVVIGKEATFKIRLQNLGDPVAESVLVRINTPLGAQIVAAQASRGQTNAIAATKQKPLEWRLDRLDAHDREFLTLRIVPRKSDSFDLGVTWTLAPIASQTRIKVQEPKLALEINGPHEIEYGDTKIYRLTITNPGNGVADNVQLKLKPLDGSDRPMAVRNIGSMEPGAKQIMEVELTARQEGYLNVEALAMADTDLETNARQRVLVRRAQLGITANGPEMNYAGTTATYRFRVANQGNSSAENIRVVATLPTGGEYLESSDQGEWHPESRQIVWDVPALVAQNHQNFEVRASLSHPGENTFRVRLSADDDLATTSQVVTLVEALADLQLVINDPRGPVPVEEETTYEVLISNRGTKAAEMVDVVVFFSDGIEPLAVAGGTAKVETGQVVFHPIEQIAPGEEVIYKITAHANRSGNHVFRTEVACEAADVRLVAEESTRFYGSGAARADTPEKKTDTSSSSQEDSTPSQQDSTPDYRREKS